MIAMSDDHGSRLKAGCHWSELKPEPQMILGQVTQDLAAALGKGQLTDGAFGRGTESSR